MAKNHILRSSDTKIIATDSLLTAVIVGLLLYSTNIVHPIFCFIIAFLVAAGMALLFYTRVGYWIVTVLYSGVWGILWALIASALSNNNAILEWAAGIIACVASIFLHRAARRFHEIVSEDSIVSKDP